MQFFEVTERAEKAARLGRWMMDQTYKIKENHELANAMSRVGQKLESIDSPFGYKFEDFDANEVKLIKMCQKAMDKINA